MGKMWNFKKSPSSDDKKPPPRYPSTPSSATRRANGSAFRDMMSSPNTGRFQTTPRPSTPGPSPQPSPVGSSAGTPREPSTANGMNFRLSSLPSTLPGFVFDFEQPASYAQGFTYGGVPPSHPYVDPYNRSSAFAFDSQQPSYNQDSTYGGVPPSPQPYRSSAFANGVTPSNHSSLEHDQNLEHDNGGVGHAFANPSYGESEPSQDEIKRQNTNRRQREFQARKKAARQRKEELEHKIEEENLRHEGELVRRKAEFDLKLEQEERRRKIEQEEEERRRKIEQEDEERRRSHLFEDVEYLVSLLHNKMLHREDIVTETQNVQFGLAHDRLIQSAAAASRGQQQPALPEPVQPTAAIVSSEASAAAQQGHDQLVAFTTPVESSEATEHPAGQQLNAPRDLVSQLQDQIAMLQEEIEQLSRKPPPKKDSGSESDDSMESA